MDFTYDVYRIINYPIYIDDGIILYCTMDVVYWKGWCHICVTKSYFSFNYFVKKEKFFVS